MWQEHAGSLDGIIDTVSAKHPLPDYLNLLKLNGRLVTVGVPPEPLELPTSALIFQRRLVGGSLIGGIKETQEMLVSAQSAAITCSRARMRSDPQTSRLPCSPVPSLALL